MKSDFRKFATHRDANTPSEASAEYQYQLSMKGKMAMKKMMMAVSKDKSNMTESDGRDRKNTENRSERRPILW
jgi:hypothetical protein